MTAFALSIRFLLELGALGAVAAWGFHIGDGAWRPILALAVPAAFALAWAVLAAPKADNPLTPGQRELIGSGLLLAASGALALTGRTELAMAFAALIVLDTAALVALPDRPEIAVADALARR